MDAGAIYGYGVYFVFVEQGFGHVGGFHAADADVGDGAGTGGIGRGVYDNMGHVAHAGCPIILEVAQAGLFALRADLFVKLNGVGNSEIGGNGDGACVVEAEDVGIFFAAVGEDGPGFADVVFFDIEHTCAEWHAEPLVEATAVVVAI